MRSGDATATARERVRGAGAGGTLAAPGLDARWLSLLRNAQMASASASAGAASAGKKTSRLFPGRRVGMRLWLGAAFAAVTLITALRRLHLRRRLLRADAAERERRTSPWAARPASPTSSPTRTRLEAARILNDANTETFEVWAVNRRGGPFAPQRDPAGDLAQVEQARRTRSRPAGRPALPGRPTGDRTLAVGPDLRRQRRARGGGRASRSRPPALTRAFDDLQGDRLRALADRDRDRACWSGFVVSSLIAIRVKRLARSAEQMAAGQFDAPLPAGGGDEIGDLTRSLDTMREALRDSFDLLATERDRLSAILDGLREGGDRRRRGRRGALHEPGGRAAGAPTGSPPRP